MINNKKGFTLIEVLVALLITGIVLSSVYYLFIKAWNMNMEQNEYIYVQDALRVSGLEIESDIRRSSQSIEIVKNDTCYTITDENSIVYCVNDNILFRNGKVLIDSIKSLKLEVLPGNTYVKIELIGTYNGKDITHEKKIYLRTP